MPAQEQRGLRSSLGRNASVIADAAGSSSSYLHNPEPRMRGRRHRSRFEEYGNRLGLLAGTARPDGWEGSARAALHVVISERAGTGRAPGRQRGSIARGGRGRAAASPGRVRGSAIAPRRAAATSPVRMVARARRGRPGVSALSTSNFRGRLRFLPKPTTGASGGEGRRGTKKKA